MKKIFLAILAIIGLTSCSDYLDKEPDTEVTIDEVFSQKNLQERWLGYCYSGIKNNQWFTIHTSGWDALADDMCPSERWQQWNDWQYSIPRCYGNWSSQTHWPGNFWAQYPKLIRDCLIFQERAKAVPADGLSSSEVELMKIETRFLIAYYYYQLLNVYGPFPFRPGYLAPTEFNLSDLMTGPEPFEDIADWIDKELLEVSKLLPASYANAQKYGRATSIMCLAVRARLALFRASPLVNGNPDYANHVDHEGRNLFSTQYNPKLWEDAAKACKELIDAAHAAGHHLYYAYNEDGTIDPFTSCEQLHLPTNATDCPEILFARNGNEGNGDFQHHCSPSGDGGASGLGVTQEYVDAFFDETGLPITDPASVYVEDGFSTEDEIRYAKWEAGEPTGDKQYKKITHTGTYNMYTHREPRFYVNVWYSGAWYSATTRYLDLRLNQYVGNKRDNVGNHDAPQNGYLQRKRVNPKFISNPRTDFHRPSILYRLGEAYLNYAEALNESGTNQSDMLLYLNKIRERAGIRQYTTGPTDDNFIHVDAGDKDKMREIIKAERRIELACEGGLRYDDLRRWKDAEKMLNRQMTGMDFTKSDNDFFKRVPCQDKRVYKKQYYWMPVHQSEIDKNPNLIQAPYWSSSEE